MDRRFTLECVDATTDPVDVRDLDELDDREMTCLLQLANDESPGRVEPKTAMRLSEYGVIKFTEYVHVSRTDSHTKSECR